MAIGFQRGKPSLSQKLCPGKCYPALLLLTRNCCRFLHLSNIQSSSSLAVTITGSSASSNFASSAPRRLIDRHRVQHFRRLQQQANNPVVTRMASAQEQRQQQHEESKLEGASDYDKVLHQQKHVDSAPPISRKEEHSEGGGDDDLMSESYGEGYATRSSEEGFGGIYSAPMGGSARGAKGFGTAEEEAEGRPWPQEDVSSDNFDKTQGSPVAEKEKTRHGQGMVS